MNGSHKTCIEVMVRIRSIITLEIVEFLKKYAISCWNFAKIFSLVGSKTMSLALPSIEEVFQKMFKSRLSNIHTHIHICVCVYIVRMVPILTATYNTLS